MQVDLYHVVSNSHMAEALFAYVPKDRLLVEGDFFDVAGSSTGGRRPMPTTSRTGGCRSTPTSRCTGASCRSRRRCKTFERMTKAAEDVCSRTQSAGVFTPGCPVKTPAAIGDGPDVR